MITITDMHLCAGGNHMIFTAVDENGKDASFTKDVAEVYNTPIVAEDDTVIAFNSARTVIKESDAKTLEEAKLAVLGGKV